MWISRIVCLFMIYSCLGWIYETTFCTIKDGKWENRGFTYGPVCPIYGSGAVGISLVMHLAARARTALPAESSDVLFLTGRNTGALEPWQIFIISVLGSAVLEYATSWVLEKLFHAVWWDYHRLPFNLHGRISLFTSLGFGFAGLLVVYVIAPFTESKIAMIPPILTEFLSLCFLAVFMVDLTLTVTALLHFDQVVVHAEDVFNRKMEGLVESTVQKKDQLVESTIQKKDQFVESTIQKKDQFVESALQRKDQFVENTMQRTEQLRQNLQLSQRYMSSMSSVGRSAVKRIRAFRHDNKDHETTGNRLLTLLRKESGNDSSAES